MITICLCAFCVKLLQVRALTTQISSQNSLKLLNLREASRKRLPNKKIDTLTINIEGGGHDGETEGNG